MNRSDAKQKSANGAVASTTTTRLTGSWLIIARTVWLMLVIPSVGLFIVSLIGSYQQLQKPCVDDAVTCNISGALPAQALQQLPTIGLSVNGFAVLVTIFFAINAAIWYGIGFLIFWRRSDDWLALLAAFFLVMFNITTSGNTSSSLAFAYPIFTFPLNFVNFLGQVSLLGFFLLFPNGRPVPRWMGLFLLLIILEQFLSAFPSIGSLFNAIWPVRFDWVGPFIAYGTIIYSQIYRYRRVSNPVERQQTKWIVLGVVVAIVIILGILAISALVPPNVTSNTLGLAIFYITVWPIALLLIPLSIGFSILRYRLYDIDVLINRTLVYGTLTALLALLYFGLVIGLQSLVHLFTGQVSQFPIVIVASTLAIAALFQPLRQRIQVIIDRRFYRRKYDAAKTLETFSATLRHEVDLTQLCEHMLNVVQETMQPMQVSLWLRQPTSGAIPSHQTHKAASEEASTNS